MMNMVQDSLLLIIEQYNKQMVALDKILKNLVKITEKVQKEVNGK